LSELIFAVDRGDPSWIPDSEVRLVYAGPDVGLGDPDHLPPEVRIDLSGVGACGSVHNSPVWVVIVNDDPSLTANVTIEFVVGEELNGACCGSTVFIGMAILVGAVAFSYVLKRK
jgi:hypothetical protein